RRPRPARPAPARRRPGRADARHGAAQGGAQPRPVGARGALRARLRPGDPGRRRHGRPRALVADVPPPRPRWPDRHARRGAARAAARRCTGPGRLRPRRPARPPVPDARVRAGRAAGPAHRRRVRGADAAAGADPVRRGGRAARGTGL
ncbi:MAG: hypothetical protein AVDCRST_MAG66-1432, partial [uncultured Pseudonocardia sp.]